MRVSPLCAFFPLAAIAVLVTALDAQSVISTHSGVIHFFEGTVYLGDQALEPHLGRFPNVPQGAELRTADGRAEVLLTPGVFLRLGEKSAIRMVASDLTDTQVEVETGSVMVEAGEPNANTSVTLILKDWRVHLLQKGDYRIDSEPPRLCVRQGRAEVRTGANGTPVTVEHGMSLPLAGVLVPEKESAVTDDALNNWVKGRNESIVADNAIMSQIDENPALQAAGFDKFTYYPFLDVPFPGTGYSGLYSSYSPYQSGFSSIYLPGYNYRPLLLGPIGLGLRTYLPISPGRIGVTPVGGGLGTYPRTPYPRAYPRPVPSYGGPIRSVAPVGVHGAVGHR